MTVAIPDDAELDGRLLDASLIQEHGTEILGVAAGFPIAGVGLTQVFSMIDAAALTPGQKAWAKVAATAGIGGGAGLAVIALARGVKQPSIQEFATFAGVGALAVSLGSLALQVFSQARGVGILARRQTAQGQVPPAIPEELVPIRGFEFR